MTTADPTFSLIVNTSDRAGPLQTLLRALEHQSYRHFEVIVVVGPAPDNTLEMLSKYKDRARVLHCPKANLGQSRNIGLLAARGEIVAFIDDDAVPSQRWLEQLARLFQDPYLDASGGIVYLIHPYQPMIQHRIGIVSSLAEQIDVRSSWLDHMTPPGDANQWVGRMMGTNMAFRRQALLDVGGFDEFFVWVFDDADIALRLTNAGKIVHPVQEAAVYHVPASSRRRVAYTVYVDWWIHIKSAIYISIKSGRAAGDSRQAITQRCKDIVRDHWQWTEKIRQEEKFTTAQFARMRLAGALSALNGAARGILLSRKLLKRSAIEACRRNLLPIQSFQNDASPRQPAVDPVSGYCPAVSLPEPSLRICLLSNAYPPVPVEGVGRLTHLMARGLFECGHTVHVITFSDEPRLSFYDGAYVHHITCPLERYSRYLNFPNLHHALNRSHAIHQHVKKLALNDGIQIVDSPLWQFEGLVTATSGDLPVAVRLVTAHRQIAELQNERGEEVLLTGNMEQTLIERATHILPNTQATFRTAQKIYSFQPIDDRYTIVPYGIVPVPDEQVAPFDLERDTGALTVLFVGRLEQRKGIRDLFEAMPLVLEQVPNTRFIIAGGDNSKNDGFQERTGMDYPAYFESHYRDILPRVQFKGSVSEQVLQKLYRSCDLFVAPSLFESFGLIYLEAMNFAKPVIGCRSGGVPEVIDHGVTGLLVEPGAPAALAEALVSLLRSPVKLREMGLAGRQQILERFNYIQMAHSFAQAYRLAIQSFSAGSFSSPDLF